MKRLIVILIIVQTIIFLGTISGTGKTKNTGEFLLASVDTQLDNCFYSFTDRLQYELGVWDGSVIEVGSVESVFLRQFTENDEGKTFWWTDGDVNFDVIPSYLTDGKPNLTIERVLNAYTGQGWGTGYKLEAGLFGDQVGPNGVDLGGFTIHRVGLRLNNVELWDIPSGTCCSTDTTLLFTQAADKGACKHGGWEFLESMDGASFKNQGECIRYANTGK